MWFLSQHSRFCSRISPFLVIGGWSRLPLSERVLVFSFLVTCCVLGCYSQFWHIHMSCIVCCGDQSTWVCRGLGFYSIHVVHWCRHNSFSQQSNLGCVTFWTTFLENHVKLITISPFCVFFLNHNSTEKNLNLKSFDNVLFGILIMMNDRIFTSRTMNRFFVYVSYYISPINYIQIIQCHIL